MRRNSSNTFVGFPKNIIQTDQEDRMRNLLDWCSATVCCVSTRAGKNARKTDENFGIEEYMDTGHKGLR